MRTLRLPAREESLPQFRQLALEEAARAGLDTAALQRVELVLEEALVNVIRHAYTEETPDEARPVELTGGADPDGGFVLALSDWGQAFDPVGAADGEDGSDAELLAGLESNLEADLEHREPGGMGLFLIRTMSRSAYQRTNGANVLTLRFPQDAETD
ncbi:MAG TPA: ATP-binding protein [Humidesulfovibrio sp.]|uniref:ATP-binding protein n=1 Tax=Humidesulfovibrio sp. TaxID=2910988 RepID=UPI002CA08BEE|nr:ATP-binding protein [Humidesulfovibrio sp.]HWR03689.1 ATP-binding protein [Humidesulfovibrio sp.]